MADFIALVFEVIATIVWETVAWFAEVLFWPARRKETSVAARDRRALPEADRILVQSADRRPGSAISPNGELARSIKLGRVRCWLAGCKQTLTHPNAAVLLVAGAERSEA